MILRSVTDTLLTLRKGAAQLINETAFTLELGGLESWLPSHKNPKN